MPEAEPLEPREAPVIATFWGPAGKVLVRRGDVVLLRGPNGCGKTRVLRSLAGLPGRADGAAPERPNPLALPAGAEGIRDAAVMGVPSRQTPAEGLQAAFSADRPRDSLAGLTVEGEFRLRQAPAPSGMQPFLGRASARLSTGEARRVGLAAAVAQDRPLLLLDEPLEGLDATGRADWVETIGRHARQGAVVLADHPVAGPDGEPSFLDRIATRVVSWPGTAGGTGPDDIGDPSPSQPASPAPQPPTTVAGSVARPGGRDATPPPSLAFPGADVVRGGMLLRFPSFDLGPGYHEVTGPNGAGKSTLLLALAGEGPAAPSRPRGSGSTRRAGRTPPIAPEPAPPRLLLPSARDHFSHPSVRIELAEAGIPLTRDGTSGPMGDVLALVPQHLMDRHPASLSAGEAQRVAIALALGRPARAYLLDEPESHLDESGRRLLRTLLERRASQSIVAVATHHPRAARGARIELPAPKAQEGPRAAEPPLARGTALAALAGAALLTALALAAPGPVALLLLAAWLPLAPAPRRFVLGVAATVAFDALAFALLVPGPGWSWGRLSLSAGGLAEGALLGARLGAVAALNAAILHRCGPERLLEAIRLPSRGTALAAALALAARDIGDEAARLALAARLAGRRAGARLAGPLLVRALERSAVRRDALRLAGHDVGPMWVPVLAMAALAAAGRIALLPIPNVKLTYVVVFLAGLLYGARVGIAAAALAMLATDVFLSGLAPAAFANVPAMALLGASGGLARATGLLAGDGPVARTATAAIGFAATLAFSAVADVATWLVVPGLDGAALRALVLAGLAFNLVPALANAAVFAAAVPAAARHWHAWQAGQNHQAVGA